MMSVEAAFHHFDTDHSGALSVDELREVLKRPGGGAPLSDAEIQEIIDEFDASELLRASRLFWCLNHAVFPLSSDPRLRVPRCVPNP